MKLKAIFSCFTALTVITASLGLYFYYSVNKKAAFNEDRLVSISHSDSIQKAFSQMIMRYQRITLSLSRHPELILTLTQPAPDNVQNTNELLDLFNSSLQTSVCYLMNKDGIAVASSNRNEETSFVGKNYSFRTYFKDAVKGKPSVYMAQGITSKIRGIYFSHPVYNDEGGLAGVVVIKEDMEAVEKDILARHAPTHAEHKDFVFIVDPNGVIFISDHPQMLLHVMWEIHGEEIRNIESTKQFGKGPWVWSGFKKIDQQRVVDQAGRKYSLIYTDIPELHGWKIVHLNDLDAISKRVASSFFETAGYMVLFIAVVLISVLWILVLLATRAEKSIKNSEERYRSAVETVNEGIVLKAATGEILTWNPGAEKIFGLPADAVTGKKTDEIEWRIIHKDGSKYSEKDFPSERTLQTGEPLRNKLMGVLQPHGDVRWISINTNPMFRGDEKLPYAVAISFSDITDYKQAEEALRDSEQRYRTTFDAIPDSITVTRVKDGRYQYVNDGFCSITGYSKEEVIGKTPRDINLYVTPENRENMTETLRKNGELLNFEIQFRRKDGTVWDSFFTARPIELDGEDYLIALTKDVTAIKKTEEEKHRLEAQLLQVQKIESIGRLAGGVAHDFNNMLSVIIGSVDIILDDWNSSPPSLDVMLEIKKAAERSANLTRQLLAFARQQAIVPKVIELNVTIEGMLNMLRRLIGEDIDLNWRPKVGLWPVKVDPSQVDQILANLCVNARDSIKGIGNVTIETDNVTFDEDYCGRHAGFSPGDYVMIAVSDTGGGMDKETLDNLFEPFFTTKDIGYGTGLGLATVYGIVKQNKGIITVDSELDSGTTFQIYLPRHLDERKDESKQHLEEVNVKGHETILLVEDEEAILRMTEIMLVRLGYAVITTADPLEALNLGESHKGKIDLLITDVIMPKMNGRDLAEKLRGLYPRLKCLFMSGYTDNIIAHHGILNEEVYFINKPFTKQDLSIKVREVLDAGKSETQRNYG